MHPLVVEAFELDGEVVVFFELDLNRLFDALPQARQSVKSLARFPASLRDISILVDRDIPAARVQRIIEGQPLVEQTVLFDVYEGEEAPPGKVSLAYRIQLRASNRTLSSRDVNRSLAPRPFAAGKRSGSGPAGWYRRKRHMKHQDHGHGHKEPRHHGGERGHYHADMLSVEAAFERIISAFSPLEPEAKPILEALGQTLAEDVYSPLNIPPSDNSAMDGYALRYEDVRSASAENPVVLRVIGLIAAGQIPDRRVEPGTALRIMTGAPTPEGCDNRRALRGD